MNALGKLIKGLLQFPISVLVYAYFVHKFRNVDFMHYRELADVRFCAPKFLGSVFLYGNYKAISKLTHRKFNFFRDYCEHGVCFSDAPESAKLLGYVDRRGIHRVYTFSQRRKKALETFLKTRKSKAEVIAVGPYILGVSHFLSEEKFNRLKEKFGKTLLVFPTHTIETNTDSYRVDRLNVSVEQKRKDFETVMVCMYWNDVLHQSRMIGYYERNGYVVVSAGHRNDPKFLNRLRDIILLADVVMLNSVGTNLGYSVALKKLVWFVERENIERQEGFANLCLQELAENVQRLNEKCVGLFPVGGECITAEQIDFVENYWGKNED